MSAGIAGIVAAWQADEQTAARLAHVGVTPAKGADHAGLEPPPPPDVRRALEERGIERLYTHQVAAIEHLRAGRHTVVVASTAAGKSLAYQIPIAEAVSSGGTALLVYPTKALTQDQLRGLDRIGGPSLIAATYDGDTERDQRRWVRRHATAVLTNPDMLHVGILPNHKQWAAFLARLSFVVVDELHTLRGIFGSHVAHVLRRLRRLADHYGAAPTFAFTSATIGNPGELAERLIEAPVAVVADDGSPAGEKHWVLWNPEADEETGERASPLTAATEVFTDLVSREQHTIAFARSRKASELVYRWSRDRLDPELANRIAPYRGGYLPEERRRIEQELFSGRLLGVTTTNALELGIDVGDLDAAVVTTFPGTIASFRQQAGRAGRSLRESLAVLIGGQDALDQYYMAHPEELFGRSAEAAVVNPDNPDVMRRHVGCAAFELPLTPEDRSFLGDSLEELVPDLVADDELVLRNGRLLWAGGSSPARSIDIRTSGGPPFTIVDDRGRLLGSIDEGRAQSQCHPGAVYLHQGDGYLVDALDTSDRFVHVHREEAAFYTQPKIDKDLRVVETTDERMIGAMRVAHGRVDVTTQVLAYQKKSIRTGEVLDLVPLDLPERRFTTQAFWYVFPEAMLEAAGITPRRAPGTLHAAEHTGIAILPRFAICDRWDVGGLSITFHPQLGVPVFFIYDGYPGGAGIAPIGFEAASRHVAATLEVLERCPCREGCPSCVQSPKCGNFNDPLDKTGAASLIRLALAG
jgi:DEAD/DEAH box helicase domain-containing protein